MFNFLYNIIVRKEVEIRLGDEDEEDVDDCDHEDDDDDDDDDDCDHDYDDRQMIENGRDRQGRDNLETGRGLSRFDNAGWNWRK